MRGNEFLDKMELIEPSYVEAADAKPKNRKNAWIEWVAMAACFCLVVGGSVFYRNTSEQPRSILHWSQEWAANDYFLYCNTTTDGVSTSNSLDSSAIPYAEERDFSDWRELLEADEVVPMIDSHPLFNCIVHYNDDGSVFSVNISWHRRGEKTDYSDLSIIAGYQVVEQIEDCISIEVDAKGNIVEPHITVTERDGVQIIAEGRENQGKTITFQNERGWYQISGSFNDSYESVVELLDWFWEHPLDFSRFPMESGNNYESATLAEYPEAFSRYLPDFAGFGFVEAQALLILKNGEPVTFEGHYVAHVDEDVVKAGNYYNAGGHTTMHWCFKTEPDFYDVQRCIGELSELTEQIVTEELSKESSVAFMWDENCVIIFPDDPVEAWELIESLLSK